MLVAVSSVFLVSCEKNRQYPSVALFRKVGEGTT